MEARLQYYDPVRDSRGANQYFQFDPELVPAAAPTGPSDEIQTEAHAPAEHPQNQDVQHPSLPYPTSSPPVNLIQTFMDESEDTAPKVEFSTQWNNRKEAIWDIVGPKRGVEAFAHPAPYARAAPEMWAENMYDAQDVLPYFTVGQTILASKTPREVSRSVLLTKNLHGVCADWRAGKIQFTVRVRYKLQLNRPKKWKPLSSPSKLANVNCKPMDPVQFRKLRACYEGGIPVRVLATGDFPFLPTFQPEPREEGGPVYPISSNSWRDGVVMLGFFWVTKIVELDHSSEKEDLDTGKCSGRSKWAFEFLYCGANERPPWWCPLGDDSEEDSTQSDNDMQEDEEWELENLSKRRRIDTVIDSDLCDDVLMLERAEPGGKTDESKVKAVPNYTLFDYPIGDWALRRANPGPDGIYAHPEINAYPGCLPIAENFPVSTTIDASTRVLSPRNLPKIPPGELGLALKPVIGTSGCMSRAPKLRASLLLGWHCLTCGRLNPRRIWSKNQECPLCKTISTALILPEWHRRAHTEAAGPIGTLFRLDDGGHQPKTGLHQMAVRDETTGLTFVEYWLAEAPMPIIAELHRVAPSDRRKTRNKTAAPKMLEVPPPETTSSPNTPIFAPNPTPDASAPNVNTETRPRLIKDGTHPDGGKLIRQRDPGGSRAVFSENTRMLFMHITCPQHSAGLGPVDQIFSKFATDVQMERQDNNTSYRTGASALSCHYTYLAGCGTHVMHTSSPAVDWKEVPACVYDAHSLLVDYQTHTVFDDNKTIREFNQSIYIMGNGATGTSSFRITHRAQDGPVGYMVFGASCSIEILIGDGDNRKRTTKGGAARRAEILLGHGDALMTMPVEDDAPLEVRVKRTGLAVVSIARYVEPEPVPAETAQAVARKERLPVLKQSATPAKRQVTPAKRKARTPSVKHSKP